MSQSSQNRLGRNPFQKGKKVAAEPQTKMETTRSTATTTPRIKRTRPATQTTTEAASIRIQPEWLEKAYVSFQVGTQVTRVILDIAKAAIFKA